MLYNGILSILMACVIPSRRLAPQVFPATHSGKIRVALLIKNIPARSMKKLLSMEKSDWKQHEPI